jgi:psp operon transcriptional activator
MTDELPPVLGESASFRETLSQVSRLAPLERPVLIVGERGTGKELMANRLTFLSKRWERPFVQLNCAALAESLLDSELFGHEAGAFTGAVRRRAGRFELADTGTLFLDEVAQASQAVQEKILRVVEYGVFERVGGSAPVRVDVRLIAATNVDLPAAVAEGKFRADLLDRLAFDVVNIPPLRERPDDILLLAEHFAVGMARTLGRDYFGGFAPAAREALLQHRWPGNVRELRNAVERSVARAARPDRPLETLVLDPFDTPWRSPHRHPRESGDPAAVDTRRRGHDEEEAASPPPSSSGFEESVLAYEAGLLREALEKNRFNQQGTARALGLGYHQLRHLLKKHGLIPAKHAS